MHLRVVAPEAAPDAVLLRKRLPPVRRVLRPERRANLVSRQHREWDAVAFVQVQGAFAHSDGGEGVPDIPRLATREAAIMEGGRERLWELERERDAEGVGAWRRVRAAGRPERGVFAHKADRLVQSGLATMDYPMCRAQYVADVSAICDQ